MSEAMRWIPCSERMPEIDSVKGYGENVLAFDPARDGPFVAYRGGVPTTRWIDAQDADDEPDVTHWMPLPPPPPEARP